MYFEWVKKPFVRPSDLDGTPTTTDAIVVGAGPVGLATAITLAQRGLKVVVLEQRDTVSDGSRAIGFHINSQQLFDHIGISEEFGKLRHARPMNWLLYNGEVFAQTKYVQPTHQKHPDQAILQQCFVEEMLVDRAAQLPGVDVRWLSGVTSLTQDDDQVTVQVETPEGSYSLSAPYLVAADGARGTVRRELGMKWDHPVDPLVSDRKFIIVDFELETDLDPGRRLYLDLPYEPGSSALFHYQPFGVWRLDYPLPDGVDAEDAMTDEAIHERVRKHLDMMGQTQDFKVVWTSMYRARARTLPTYLNGRVLFAGDSAHQTPIFGGRGLNSGFADVMNLGWRLPRVIRGIDSPASLERYSEERRQVLVDTLGALTQVTMFMTQPTEGVKVARRAALELATTQPFVRELVDGHSAIKIEAFATSPGTRATVGRPIIECALTDAVGEAAFLRDHLGSEFTLLAYEPAGELPDLSGVNAEVATLTVRSEGAASGELVDHTGHLAKTLELVAGDLLLLRPDGYVAEHFSAGATAADVVATIAAVTGRTPEDVQSLNVPQTVTQRMFLALAELAETHRGEDLAVELSKALLVLANQASDDTVVEHLESLAAAAHAARTGA